MRGVAVLALTLALAGAASATNAPDVQQRIVPGQSIARVRLGMTLAQVRRALGPLESTISSPPARSYR